MELRVSKVACDFCKKEQPPQAMFFIIPPGPLPVIKIACSEAHARVILLTCRLEGQQ